MVLFQDIIKVALSGRKIHQGEKRERSNLRRGSFCPTYKVQIITGDIPDGFLPDSKGLKTAKMMINMRGQSHLAQHNAGLAL